MYSSVAARSAWTKRSPASGSFPPGRKIAALEGHIAYAAASEATDSAKSSYTAKPSRANRIASAATAPNVIVP